MLQLTRAQIVWYRLRRSGLVQPFAGPEEAARALAGAQAQILPAAGLALWNRSRGLTAARFDRLLYDERTLVKLWGQRGTLHLYASDDWPLIHGASGRRLSWEARQLVGKGDGQQPYIAVVTEVAEMLRRRGTMTRSELRAEELELDESLYSAWGGIFADLVRQGYACHAGREGNEGLFAHREHWLPELVWNPPEPDEANTELLRRYLHTYGPAPLRDFAYWRAAKVDDARRWLAKLDSEVVEVEAEGQTLLALASDLEAMQAAAPAERDDWPVRLLYRFDPLLLAHKDKTWLVEAAHYSKVWRPAGHIEGTLLYEGRLHGAWRYDRTRAGLAITLVPFGPLPAYVLAEVERLARQVADFWDLPLAALDVKPVGEAPDTQA